MTGDEYLEAAAQVMHEAYEEAASRVGWQTQQASRKPWAEVPEANKLTMKSAVQALLKWQIVLRQAERNEEAAK